MSLVTFPGYDTPASVRELAEAADVEPDKLAEAFASSAPRREAHRRAARTPPDGHRTRGDAPYLNPKLASMRERLLALAG
jgi:hypothetical protein